MKTQMIVNRVNDWYQIQDLALDDCFLAMNILQKLSTRRVVGHTYDRIKLVNEIMKRQSSEGIQAIDKAIVILFSRNLIRFEEKKYGEKKMLITDNGVKAIERYEELINNVD